MTRDGEILVLREHLGTCARLRSRLSTVRKRIEHFVPLSAGELKVLDDDDDVNVLAFLKTYEQFEDTLGRTLKTIAMLMKLGQSERLMPRDVANRAVALGLLADGKAWADAVRTRNELAHEYPLNPVKQAAQINAAWEKSETLIVTEQAIIDFVDRERLLHGDL